MNGVRKILHENYNTSFGAYPFRYPATLDNSKLLWLNGLGCHSRMLCKCIRLVM